MTLCTKAISTLKKHLEKVHSTCSTLCIRTGVLTIDVDICLPPHFRWRLPQRQGGRIPDENFLYLSSAPEKYSSSLIGGIEAGSSRDVVAVTCTTRFRIVSPDESK